MRHSREDRLFRRFRRSGQTQDLAAVFDLTAPELLRVASHLVGDGHGAEDLVQTTFLEVLQHAERHDDDRPVLPWLLGILANQARNHLRARRRVVDAGRSARPEPRDPADLAAAAEFGDEFGTALGLVHDPYRQVLKLHLLHGLSAREISDVLERPAGTVRTQITRGMEFLRKSLPVGFAASATVAVTSGAGLAAVRGRLLDESSRTVGASALALPTTLGSLLLMKKTIAVAVAVMLCWLSFEWIGWTRVLRDPEVINEGTAGLASDGSGDVDRHEVGEPGQRESEPMSPEPDRDSVQREEQESLKASLRVFVRYSDGSPAPGVVVTLDERKAIWTNDDGVAEAVGLSPEGVAVRLAQNSRVIRMAELVAGKTTSIELKVPAAKTIRGTVTDQAGRPVAGAMLFTRNFRRRYAPVGRCDAEGKYILRDFNAMDVIARADGYEQSAPGYNVAVFFSEKTTVDLVMGDAAPEVKGQILGVDGRPLVGAEIGVTRLPIPENAEDLPIQLYLDTDETGAFSCRQMAPGDWLLFVAGVVSGRPVRHSQTISFGAGGLTGLRIRAAAGAEIEGLIRHHDGRVAPNTMLVLTHQDPRLRDNTLRVVDRYSDANGRFRFDGLVPGRYELRTNSQPPHLVQSLDVVAGERKALELRRPTPFRIRLRIVDASGRPIAACRVTELSDHPKLRSRQTDELGAVGFLVQKIEHRRRFAIEVPVVVKDGGSGFAGLPSVITESLAPVGEAYRIVVNSAHLPKASLIGTVIDAAGDAVRTQVFLHPKGHPELACPSLEYRGRIDFPFVPAGDYVLSIGLEKRRTRVRELTVEYAVRRDLGKVIAGSK